MRLTNAEGNKIDSPKRASVWSVSEGWLTAYFLLFTIQFILGLSLIIWYEIAVVADDSLAETLLNILGRAGTIPILSASTSYIFAEGGRLTMVISNWVERKLEERRIKREQALIERARKEGIEQGIKQGLEQGIEQGLEQGLEQGVEQGIIEGFERGRTYERKLIAGENVDEPLAEGEEEK